VADHRRRPSMNQPPGGHPWDAKKHHDNASNEVIGTNVVGILHTSLNVGQSFCSVLRVPGLSTRIGGKQDEQSTVTHCHTLVLKEVN
jgi:hypothetical protein